MAVKIQFGKCLGKFRSVFSIRHHLNEKLSGRAIDLVARLRTGDLIQKSQSVNARKGIEEKQTWLNILIQS
jgi:hypothetical protein